jgi:alpha-1,2-mannosyltransferase
MVDLRVYRTGAMSTWRSTFELYRLNPDIPFLYTPFAAVIFSLWAHLSWPAMQFTMTVASLLALALSLWWTWGLLGERRVADRLRLTALTFSVALWLEPVQQTLGFGQVNLLMMALILADFAAPRNAWHRGIGIGLAAGFKLTPAFFVVYLVVTRQFRAAVTACAVFVGTVAIGALVLPVQSRAYWSGGIIGLHLHRRDFLSNQSINGALLRLTSPQAAQLAWIALTVLVVLAGLTIAAGLVRRGQELTSVLVTAGTALLISPISWTHHFVWLAPGLALLVREVSGMRTSARWALLGGYVMLFLAWPMRINVVHGGWDSQTPLLATGLIWFVPHRDNLEQSWNFYQSIEGNYYCIGVIVLGLIWPGCRLWTLSHRV